MNEKRQMTFAKKYASVVLNILIFLFSATGFFLSCYFAKRDGYSHWVTRLLYFTQQSNLWIGFTSLLFAVMLWKGNMAKKRLQVIGLFKYIFTVSITITGIVFCTLLAPFAEEGIWTFASVLTHVVVPVLSILDFFTNESIVKAEKKHVWLTMIPPLLYFVFASILCVLKVDFGRGDPYPYFFMDYYSEVGLFGFIGEWPPQIGSFYWFVFFFLFIYGLGTLYYSVKNRLDTKKPSVNERA